MVDRVHLSEEELQYVFEYIPTALFFKDADCAYRLASKAYTDMMGIDADRGIVGQTDLDLHDDPAFGIALYKDDRRILDGSAGETLTSEVVAGEYRVSIARRAVRDSSGAIVGIAGAATIVKDDVEEAPLRQQLERALMVDQDSGANNLRFLGQWKAKRLHDADFPVTVILCDCDGTARVNETFGRDTGNLLIRETAMALIQAMPETGFCIHWGGDEFLVVCEATDEAQAEGVIRRMKMCEIDHFVAGEPLSISHGASTFQSPDGFDGAIKQAEENLRAAKKRRLGGDSQRIGGAGESFDVKTL